MNVEGNLVAEDCGFASRRIAEQSFRHFADHGYDEFLQSLESSDRADLQAWVRWLRQASPKALHEGARSLVEWSDSERLLSAFNALGQKTYIHGDEDDKDFLLPRLQAVPVTSISNAGHFCMIDNPGEFQAAVVGGLT